MPVVGATGSRYESYIKPGHAVGLIRALNMIELRYGTVTRFVHGGATGADFMFHNMVAAREGVTVEVYPMKPRTAKMAEYVADIDPRWDRADVIIHEPAPALKRNSYIVDASTDMIVFCGEDQSPKPGSGTFDTFSKATDVGVGLRMWLVYPSAIVIEGIPHDDGTWYEWVPHGLL